MTKFRTLTKEELPLFEQEFKEYLAVNGIDAESWQKIKQEEPEKAEKIVEIFADVIFNSVLMKVQYLEHVSKNSLKYFKYEAKQAVLVGLDADKVDFSDHASIMSAIGDVNSGIKTYTTSKTYSKQREEEIFDMLKNGCSISDGKMYELLKTIVKK